MLSAGPPQLIIMRFEPWLHPRDDARTDTPSSFHRTSRRGGGGGGAESKFVQNPQPHDVTATSTSVRSIIPTTTRGGRGRPAGPPVPLRGRPRLPVPHPQHPTAPPPAVHLHIGQTTSGKPPAAAATITTTIIAPGARRPALQRRRGRRHRRPLPAHPQRRALPDHRIAVPGGAGGQPALDPGPVRLAEPHGHHRGHLRGGPAPQRAHAPGRHKCMHAWRA